MFKSDYRKYLSPTLLISKINKKSYTLANDEAIILSRNDPINEGKGIYKLIFTNFIGGKITIFNSIHSFPLKYFGQYFYLYSRIQLDENFNISMHSDVLEEDIYLSIIVSTHQDLIIKRINESSSENIYLVIKLQN